MNVIILAAGVGSRLFPLTKDKPKCLIPIKGDKPLLRVQLDAIKHISPDKVIVVTGYRSNQIEEKIVEWQKHYSFPIIIEFNPFFNVSNNLASLYMARHYMDEDFIVVNGDDIFHKSVIEGLVNIKDDGIWMTISRKEKYDWDDMKIIEKDGRILKVSKKIPLEEANGESIGMILFRGKEREKFVRLLWEVMHDPEALNVFWLHAIQKAIDQGIPVKPYEVDRDKWAEMDFHPDLEFIYQHLTRFTTEKTVLENDEE